MQKFFPLILILLATALPGCSQKTAALAEKSLESRPLLHQQSMAAKQDADAASKDTPKRKTADHP